MFERARDALKNFITKIEKHNVEGRIEYVLEKNEWAAEKIAIAKDHLNDFTDIWIAADAVCPATVGSYTAPRCTDVRNLLHNPNNKLDDARSAIAAFKDFLLSLDDALEEIAILLVNDIYNLIMDVLDVLETYLLNPIKLVLNLEVGGCPSYLVETARNVCDQVANWLPTRCCPCFGGCCFDCGWFRSDFSTVCNTVVDIVEHVACFGPYKLMDIVNIITSFLGVIQDFIEGLVLDFLNSIGLSIPNPFDGMNFGGINFDAFGFDFHYYGNFPLPDIIINFPTFNFPSIRFAPRC